MFSGNLLALINVSLAVTCAKLFIELDSVYMKVSRSK